MYKREFPVVLERIGLPLVAATWILAALMVWDQTVVSWRDGPVFVGYSAIKLGVWIFLPLAMLAGIGFLWSLAVVIAAVITRSTGGPVVVAQLAAYAMAVYLMAMPYGFWQRLFIEKYGTEQAVEALVFAVDEGDRRTAEALLKTGVDVNAQSRKRGSNALHVAVERGDIPMIEHLIKHGANVNATNVYGDSPLAIAANSSWNREKVQALLSRHGGIVLRLPEEERRRISAGTSPTRCEE